MDGVARALKINNAETKTSDPGWLAIPYLFIQFVEERCKAQCGGGRERSSYYNCIAPGETGLLHPT
jgi:hypothetical protein